MAEEETKAQREEMAVLVQKGEVAFLEFHSWQATELEI